MAQVVRVAASAAVVVVGFVFALATPAHAQPAPGQPVDLGPLEDEADDVEGEVIEITGTAIPRRETTTPAPVAVVDKDELEASGMTSVGEILQNLPSQSNAINVQFNNGGDGSTRINLRGLGANRTLVLVNGRRHVPGGTGANSSVDLNAIPLAIIERVEVLKDGASALYGSDAIGGVVNIITRKDFEGTEAAIYTGTSQRGDATVYDLSVVSGMSTDRGSFLFAAGIYDQGEIFAGERDFSQNDKFYDWQCVKDGGPATLYHPDTNPEGCILPNGSSATPAGTIIDYGEATSPEWDAVVGGDCASGSCYLDPSGIRDLNGSGNSDDGTGDLYNYQPENYLLTPQRRYNFYGQGNWSLTDDVGAFFESSYTRRKSRQLLAPEPLFTVVEGITVSGDNVYNPYNRDFIDVRRRMVEADNRIFSQDIDTFRIVAGLEGDITDDWRWNAYYNFGRTSGVDINEGRLVRSRVEAALGPSFRDADGVARCGTPDAPIPDCVPLNLFGGPGTITPEMLDYITYTGIGRGFTMLNQGHVGARGTVFDTPWNGFVGAAVGGEYRRLRGESIPDPITAAGDTTGNKSEATGGYYDVWESYAELLAVPVTSMGAIRWLELNAAVRGHRYNTFGSGVTWKTGTLYRAPGGVAVRGTYSSAFRAPSIGELFAGSADSFPTVTDPCDTSQGPRTPEAQMRCSAQGIPDDFSDIRTQLRSVVGGNPDAEAETADIFTAGLVYEPPPVPGLAFTADWFWIDVDEAIQPLGASTILSACYQRGEFCDRIQRDPNTFLITTIDDRITNIGGTKTSGIDFQVRYDWQRPGIGRFRHNLEGTYLIKFNDTQPDGRIIEGKGVYDLGVHPDLKANLSTLWGLGGVGAGFNIRYIGSIEECQDDDCDTFLTEDTPGFDPALSREVSANVTADLFASYQLDSELGVSRLTLGVNNILDQDPAVIYNGFLGTSDASTYDFMGRFFYLRLVQSY